MNRCKVFVTALCALGLLATSAYAQPSTSRKEITLSDGSVAMVRSFPGDTLRGTLEVQATNIVLMDNKPDRLAHAVRIRSANGTLVRPSSLVGTKLPVVYTRESNGMVRYIWVLTEVEALAYPAKPAYSK